MSDLRCNRYTDCATCEFYRKDVFKYRAFPKGVIIPREKCLQNTIYFLLKGEVWINSDEHPDTIVHAGQFVLQPVGSKVEFRIHESAEAIIYFFDRPQNVCDVRFKKGVSLIEESPPSAIVLSMHPPVEIFMESMRQYIEDGMLCANFVEAKGTELIYLLNCYYTIRDLSAFFSPIYRYTKSFRYFVVQNYQQVKDVEAFARLGGYSVPTFRRLFKDTFNEPAYQWMLKQKCQDIHDDLMTTDAPISEICYKYGFESLSNFSHFCRFNFGKSPRFIREEIQKI